MERGAHLLTQASPALVKMLAWKYCHLSAGQVVEDLRAHQGVVYSPNFVRAVHHRLGDLINDHEAEWSYALPVPAQAVSSVAVSRDGTTVPLVGEGYRETMVGTISVYDEQGQRQHTIYVGTAPQAGKADFSLILDEQIAPLRQTYGSATWVGLADGAADNWTYLQPRTHVSILDFFHASGYLAAYARHAHEPALGQHWLRQACHDLKHTPGAAATLLAQMRAYPDQQAEPVRQAVSYFSHHADKMHYADYARQQLPIGSGVVEAGCKTLVKQRLCRSGSRWRARSVDDMLMTRALVLTAGRYEQLWEKIMNLPLN